MKSKWHKGFLRSASGVVLHPHSIPLVSYVSVVLGMVAGKVQGIIL